MSDEKKKALVTRWFKEMFEQGNLDLAAEIFDPNYVVHDTSPAPWPRGPEGPRAVVLGYRAAFPDVRYTLEDQFVAGDKVVTRWTVRGTNTGSLMGMPPTNKAMTVTGISIERIAEGKIAETWNAFDLFGLMMQLGVIPAPAAAH